MNMQELINSCLQGKSDAWDQFISLVQPVISGVGRKYTQSNTDDFSQNVYLLLIRNDFKLLRNFKDNDSDHLVQYIKSIAWKVAKNQSRANTKEEWRHVLLETAHEIAATYHDADLKFVIDDAMMKLPLEDREIIYMQQTGYKFREIAEILRQPVNTVLSKASRAKKMLKIFLVECNKIQGSRHG